MLLAIRARWSPILINPCRTCSSMFLSLSVRPVRTRSDGTAKRGGRGPCAEAAVTIRRNKNARQFFIIGVPALRAPYWGAGLACLFNSPDDVLLFDLAAISRHLPFTPAQLPGWNVQSAPLPSFCLMALGSMVQLSLLRLSKFDPAAPSGGIPASASVA